MGRPGSQSDAPEPVQKRLSRRLGAFHDHGFQNWFTLTECTDCSIILCHHTCTCARKGTVSALPFVYTTGSWATDGPSPTPKDCDRAEESIAGYSSNSRVDQSMRRTGCGVVPALGIKGGFQGYVIRFASRAGMDPFLIRRECHHTGREKASRNIHGRGESKIFRQRTPSLLAPFSLLNDKCSWLGRLDVYPRCQLA